MEKKEEQVWATTEDAVVLMHKALNKGLKSRKRASGTAALYREMIMDSLYILSEDLSIMIDHILDDPDNDADLKRIAKKLKKTYRTVSGMVHTS